MTLACACVCSCVCVCTLVCLCARAPVCTHTWRSCRGGQSWLILSERGVTVWHTQAPSPVLGHSRGPGTESPRGTLGLRCCDHGGPGRRLWSSRAFVPGWVRPSPGSPLLSTGQNRSKSLVTNTRSYPVSVPLNHLIFHHESHWLCSQRPLEQIT